MKFKKLLATLMVTAAIAGVTAAAEEFDRNFFIEYAYTNCFKVEKIGDTDKSANVLFLNYDDDGRLTSVDTTVISDFSKNYTYAEVGIDASHINENTKIVIPGESSRWVWEGPGFEMPDNPDELITMSLRLVSETEDSTIFEGWTANDEKIEISLPKTAKLEIFYSGDEVETIYDLPYMYQIISIEYDINAGLENSSYYNIYASNIYVEGRVERIEEYNDLKICYTDAGYAYVCMYDGKKRDLEEGDSFTGALDVFDRIVDVDGLGDYSRNPAAAPGKGILNEVYKNDDGKYYASIYSYHSGEETYLICDEENLEEYINILYVDGDINRGQKRFIADRAVGYTGSYYSEGIILHGKIELQYVYEAKYRPEFGYLKSVDLKSVPPVILDMTDYYSNDEYDKNGLIYSDINEMGEYTELTLNDLSEDKKYVVYELLYPYGSTKTCLMLFIMQD